MLGQEGEISVPLERNIGHYFSCFIYSTDLLKNLGVEEV